jgi:DNA-binding NarL/FixJ family response regulator
MPNRISILVADDHPLIRKGMIGFVKSLKLARKYYEAADGIEVLRLAEQHPIDLFLLDVEMPRLGGYETAKFLLAKSPKTRIIVNTMHDGHALMNGLLSLGVRGFVLKGEDISYFEKAIKQVLNGGSYVSPRLEKYVDKHMKQDSLMEFTPDEIKIVRLLSKGYSSSEIAVKLDLSVRTAETYRHRLIKRLNVANSTELVEYFHKNGLMEQCID